VDRSILSRTGRLALSLAVALGFSISTRAQNTEESIPARGQSVGRLATSLYRQVSEITSSLSISTAKKEKRIATAVRVAVVGATAYKTDPDEVMGIALQLTRAAAKAAPRFAETIANAVAFAPSVSRIEGGSSRIRIAAYAAAKAPRKRRVKAVADLPPADSDSSASANVAPRRAMDATADSQSRPETAAEAAASLPAPVVPQSAENAPAPEPQDSMQETPPSEDNGPASPSTKARMATDESSKLSVTANARIQHDDNIFISNADKVGDTIYSFEPGLDFKTGQNSLDHAALSYQEDFVRYGHHEAPSVNLANAAGEFGYDDGGLKLSANGTYQQFYQNNVDVLTLGPQALIRSNSLVIGGSGEIQLGAKTSVSIGAAYNKVEYTESNLLGGADVSFPLDFYYKFTPKLDLFTGYTYGVFRPDGDGPEAKDGYAHLGARGDFTAKLSGTVTAGYITREVAGTPQSHDFGFTGSLDYEVTPKTAANLTFARQYSVSALGQNTKNSTFTLGLTSELNPQWQVGESINYQILDYGPQLFLENSSLVTQERIDDFWSANVHVTYLYNRWVSGSLGYTLRVDHSTFSSIDFTDNVFDFTVSVRY
jgi:polysaccharide biosynthesis protein VpsM